MLWLADWIDALNRAVAQFVRWFAVAMALLQFGIVIGRYIFGVNSIWLQESVLYLHASLFMLSAGYTLLVDKHVRVDILYAEVSDVSRRRIDILGHLLFLLRPWPCLLGGPGLQCATPGRFLRGRFRLAESRLYSCSSR